MFLKLICPIEVKIATAADIVVPGCFVVAIKPCLRDVVMITTAAHPMMLRDLEMMV